jgi:hypothetical protein
MNEKDIFSWTGYDKLEKERSVDWFWALVIIGIGGATLAFIFNNYLFGVFIVIATIAIVFFATQKPHKLQCSVTQEGVSIGEQHIPFSKIESFWVEEYEDVAKLILHTKNNISPISSLYFFEKENIEILRENLAEFAEEKHLVEPISYQILEKLGF